MPSIHDHEFDTSQRVVRLLLEERLPGSARCRLTQVDATGTSNALWRVHRDDGPDEVVRLPRTAGAERGVLIESRLLPVLATSALADAVAVPRLVHAGVPGSAFPLHWIVLEWIEAHDAWSARGAVAAAEDTVAAELAAAVRALRELHGPHVALRQRGERGGPLHAVLQQTLDWLDDPRWSAGDLVDTRAVRRLVDEAAELVDEPAEVGTVHGDLIPGNLLVRSGHLHAVIDWGGAGRGDLAQDLTPAWSVFGERGRRTFRDALAVDDAAWLRGRAIALEQAVGGVLYYVPRSHALGDVMSRTLQRIMQT